MATSRLCSIPDCGKPTIARGWCPAHYKRWRLHGDPLAGDPPRPNRNPTCIIDGCDKPHEALGYCLAHYKRLRRNGDPEVMRAGGQGLAIEWIFDHLGYKSDDCLKWPFSTDDSGYGSIRYEDRTTSPHRLMCILAHGERPTADHEVAHNCGKGDEGCVNPKHLRWATHTENETDKLLHGTHQRGERNHRAKLSEDDVRDIRRLSGHLTRQEIANSYGVHRTTIGDIIRRKRWKWLT